jgi:hypothetical protein
MTRFKKVVHDIFDLGWVCGFGLVGLEIDRDWVESLAFEVKSAVNPGLS